MAITDAMTGRGFLTNDRGLTITEAGLAWLTDLGIDLASRKGSRPMIRPCLDWTERRIHLAGVVGAALCDWALRWHLVERIGFRPGAEGHTGRPAGLRRVLRNRYGAGKGGTRRGAQRLRTCRTWAAFAEQWPGPAENRPHRVT